MKIQGDKVVWNENINDSNVGGEEVQMITVSTFHVYVQKGKILLFIKG